MRYTIDVDAALVIGDSGPGTVNTKVLHFQKVSAYDGAITIKARSKDSISIGAGVTLTAVPIPYIAKYLNGAVSDNDVHVATITDDSIVEVQGDGLIISLVSASRTVGSMIVEVTDVVG